MPYLGPIYTYTFKPISLCLLIVMQLHAQIQLICISNYKTLYHFHVKGKTGIFEHYIFCNDQLVFCLHTHQHQDQEDR